MSTAPDSPNPPPPNQPFDRLSPLGALFANLNVGHVADSKDDALAAAQNDLVAERDARKAERFYWIFATVLAVDLLIFKDARTWSGPVLIGFLEFVFLISLGRHLGVSDVWTLTERIIEKWNGAIKGGG